MFTLAGLFTHFRSYRSIIHFSKAPMTSLNNSGPLINMVKELIPPLTPSKHKGQAGRIGIIGGSQEYTGAPYFAAISALKVGADLSYVICTKDSASVIKSYSPELIVLPILDKENGMEEISEWMNRIHALVVGPGLGRDPNRFSSVKGIIERAKEMKLPLVIDADGLFFITQDPMLIKDYSRVVLTPNVMEFGRLYEKVMGNQPDPEESINNVTHLSRALGYVTIVQKGENDVISDGNNVLVCCGEGSDRRCGGQGDLLSGSMGTFTYWADLAKSEGVHNEYLDTFGPMICGAYAACLLTRECNRQAFKLHGRSTLTTDMIERIGHAFERLYAD